MLVPNYGRPIPREISYGRAQTIENTLANITYRCSRIVLILNLSPMIFNFFLFFKNLDFHNFIKSSIDF